MESRLEGRRAKKVLISGRKIKKGSDEVTRNSKCGENACVREGNWSVFQGRSILNNVRIQRVDLHMNSGGGVEVQIMRIKRGKGMLREFKVGCERDS